MCNGCSAIFAVQLALCNVACTHLHWASWAILVHCLFVVWVSYVYLSLEQLLCPRRKREKQQNKQLFPDKKMIPPGLNSENCSCGYTFDSVALESRHPIIHHSKPTKDSRNSELSIHFLKTSHCDCKSYYHDENERLVRTSSAPSTKQNSSVHFVSVDFFNEYMYVLPAWEKPRRKMLLLQTKTFWIDKKGERTWLEKFQKKFFSKHLKFRYMPLNTTQKVHLGAANVLTNCWKEKVKTTMKP